MRLEDRPLVLVLNKAYQCIAYKTIKSALIAMCSSEDQIHPAASALQIEYKLNEDNSPNFNEVDFILEREWDEWIKLPVRPWDLVIHTSKLNIRIPTIVVCHHFSHMPIKKLKPTKQAIILRDKKTCQYTGKILTNKEISIDHIHPKSLGGQDSFTNMIVCHKDINYKKGNKTNKEAGLTLIKQPKAPLPIPVSALIKEARHSDHKFFISQ